MIWNPFRSPRNYAEMLQKIAFFTFLVTFLLTVLVGAASPPIKSALNSVDVPTNILGIDGIPVLYPVVAILLALAAHIMKLHDRISDLFKIREGFDVHEILTPLAGAVGVPVTLEMANRLRAKRKATMYAVFYKYADSSASQPDIQKHLIVAALGTWTWYWVLVEASVAAGIAQVFLFVWEGWQAAAWVGAVWTMALLALPFLRRWCASHARSEVAAILSDPRRVGEIKVVVDAL